MTAPLTPQTAADFPEPRIRISQSELDLLIRKCMSQQARIEVGKVIVLKAQIRSLLRELQAVRQETIDLLEAQLQTARQA